MESERMMSEDETMHPRSSSKEVKSCVGVLYAKSLKAGSLKTFCAGITRTLPKCSIYPNCQSNVLVPAKYVWEYEKAAEESRTLANFKFACVGRSLYACQERENFNGRVPQIESPICKGFRVEVATRNAAASASAPGIQIHITDGSSSV